MRIFNFIFIFDCLKRLKNSGSNLYEAIVPLSPGHYEYKFMIDGNWAWDDYKPITFDWCRNHFFSIGDHAAKIHQNISAIRAVINNYQKKLPASYPEIFVETHVIHYEKFLELLLFLIYRDMILSH